MVIQLLGTPSDLTYCRRMYKEKRRTNAISENSNFIVPFDTNFFPRLRLVPRGTKKLLFPSYPFNNVYYDKHKIMVMVFSYWAGEICKPVYLLSFPCTTLFRKPHETSNLFRIIELLL